MKKRSLMFQDDPPPQKKKPIAYNITDYCNDEQN